MSASLHVFPDTSAFGAALARAARRRVVPVDLHRFPDGESLVRVRAPVGRHAILVRALADPNERLVEVLLAADALRRAGARRVTLVAPYLPYMRQDAVFHPGEPVSQRVVGRLLGEAFDGVLTIEAHLHRVRRLAEVVPGRSRSVSAAPALAAWLRSRGGAWFVVGPDEESAPWVRAIARGAGARAVVARKVRHGDRAVSVEVPAAAGGARAVVVDDIASSGATIAATARALRAAGARSVDAIVSHAIFAPGAEARIRAAGVRRLLSCDTLPHCTNAIGVAALVAAALPRST
ncbi:MAG: ribose-phosphate diphosphokinase [Deltaproteobacteria bacterium]|nr:ribose-phosphate diphosphokinase [Deltaproteobacteria bacterium]